MAEQFNPVDFSQLTETNDGKTLLYNNGELCQSTNSLSEIVDDKIGSKDYATETFVKNEIGKVGNFIVTPGNDDGPYLNAEEAQTKSIYLIESGSGKDKYREWITTGEVGSKTWTCIGDTTMDLSDYAKTADVKIGSISIDNTELVPDENKNVNIAIESDCGLYVNNNNELSFGVDLSDTSPLCIRTGNELAFRYDGTLTMVHSGSDENYLSVAAPLPSKSNEKYRKILVLDKYKNAVWTDNISFGSGSEEGGNDYITPKIPVAVPKDFSYSEDDHHGFPSDYEIEWRDATPPAPDPGFDDGHTPIGTKKSFNLISTVQNINEGFFNTREYDYDWEETQTIPDPKTGSHNGHILTYDSSEGIVWAAPQQCQIPEYTQADAGKVLAVKADGSGLEWISLVPANAVGVNNEPVGVNGDYFTVGE